MHENMLVTASQLSDSALLARVQALALSERDATVELVAHLSVLDRRRTYLGEGPGSVYKYCHEVLGYSEDAAWNRAATANAVRRYPAILGWLADGSLKSRPCGCCDPFSRTRTTPPYWPRRGAGARGKSS